MGRETRRYWHRECLFYVRIITMENSKILALVILWIAGSVSFGLAMESFQWGTTYFCTAPILRIIREGL